MATHYEVLDASPGATAAELRAAYLAKARELHPDRHGGSSMANRRHVERAMQQVNAAWTVLSDPRARREYDESLAIRAGVPAASSARSAPPAADPPKVATVMGPPPVVLPDFGSEHRSSMSPAMRIVPIALLLGVLGVIFVFTAFAGGNKADDKPVGPTVEVGSPTPGSCVAVVGGVIEVSCQNPHALRVERVAPGGDSCVGGTVPLRWSRETTLCVRPPS